MAPKKPFKGVRKSPTIGKEAGTTSQSSVNGLLVLSIAVMVFACHWAFLSSLHENDLYFSHLSTLERELSFRTEMADSLSSGLEALIRDNVTEFPSIINTLARFNLSPELLLGVVYRGLMQLELITAECYTVDRGYDQAPVQACNGIGDPVYFYVTAVFALNGLLPVFMFLVATFISGSVLGGCVTLIMFVYNHTEATRVMWTPPLRESFAMPLFYLQLLALSMTIRNCSLRQCILLSVTTVLVLLPWQFTPLALSTQTVSLLALWSVDLIPSAALLFIFLSLTVALFTSCLIQFGNLTLLSSFFTASLLAGLTTLCARGLTQQLVPHKLIRAGLELTMAAVFTVLLKWSINVALGNSDDAHIGSLLLAKLSSYKDFHTQLYLCSKEFDFLPLTFVLKTSLTLLLPAALVVIATAIWRLFNHVVRNKNVTSDPKNSARAYHILQCVWFIVMATLIMRLKVFLTPQLCVLCSLLTLRQEGVSRKFVLALYAVASIAGLYNLQHELSIVGEFNNPAQEELVTWVNTSTNQNAVFAGAMPTMATIKLCTGRAVVNHPHYEHAGLRARTKLVYSVYSRRPPNQVFEVLRDLRVTHVIVEGVWCAKRYSEGCSFAEVWDKEEPHNTHRELFCDLVHQGPVEGFGTVFSNSEYIVLEL